MEEDDIAAAMGFSSFGAQKRKYEDRVLPQDEASSSGANAEPLGVRPKMSSEAEPEPENEATEDMEIDAGDHMDAANFDAALPDRPKPPKQKGKKKNKPPATSSLADFLTRGKYLDEHAPAPATDPTQELPRVAQSDTQSKIQQSAPVERAEKLYHFPGKTYTESEMRALADGVPTENGGVRYFLPSFVEDPWKDLLDKNPDAARAVAGRYRV
jgi:hypothetical protein